MLARRARFLNLNLMQQQRRVPFERWLPGQHLVEDHSQRVHIAPTIDKVAITTSLFRGHVRRSSQNQSRTGQLRLVTAPLRQTEVGDMWLTLRVHQNVAGLEIAMNHSRLVSVVDGIRNTGHDSSGFHKCRTLGLLHLEQRPTFDELTDNPDLIAVFFHAIDLDDVWVF